MAERTAKQRRGLLLMKRILAGILTIAYLFTLTLSNGRSVSVFASEQEVEETSTISPSERSSYDDYRKLNGSVPEGEGVYRLAASGFGVTKGRIEQNDADGRPVALVQSEGTIDASIDLEQAGLYEIVVEYRSDGGSNRQFEFDLRINGESPFHQAKSFTLPKLWENNLAQEGTFERDALGNELQPAQREVMSWQSRVLSDVEGYYAQPFLFRFDAGNNTLTLHFRHGNIAVSGIVLSPHQEPEDYRTVASHYETDTSTPLGVFQKIEGESAVTRSDPALKPTSDRSSSMTSPDNGARAIVLNTIGQHNWRYIGQSMTWRIDVPSAGLYQIGARVRQNLIRGASVSRRVRVNGQVPFQELDRFRFAYHDTWTVETFGNDDDPFLIYLEEGPNDITLEATTTYPEVIRSLQSLVTELSLLYRDIIMITGIDPDGYRDYQLDRQIDGFADRLVGLREDVAEAILLAGSEGFDNSSQAVVLGELDRQLTGFSESMDTIPSRLNPFKDNISALGRWIFQMKEQPLEIDYLFIKSPDVASPEANGTVWEKFIFTIQLFLSSFVNDYNAVSASDPGSVRALEVWIALIRPRPGTDPQTHWWTMTSSAKEQHPGQCQSCPDGADSGDTDRQRSRHRHFHPSADRDHQSGRAQRSGLTCRDSTASMRLPGDFTNRFDGPVPSIWMRPTGSR
jgi:hypothetical protein